jgi:hypothetical protein
MTLQRAGENFRTLDAQAHTIVLDGGDSRLRNARHLGEPVLAHLLELAKNPDRLSDAYGCPLLGGAIV